MDINKFISEDGKNLTVEVKGEFNFNKINQFKASYNDITPSLQKITIDMADTIQLDSSALCLLLDMKNRCQHIVKHIYLSNCQPKIKTAIKMAGLDDKFVYC